MTPINNLIIKKKIHKITFTANENPSFNVRTLFFISTFWLLLIFFIDIHRLHCVNLGVSSKT